MKFEEAEPNTVEQILQQVEDFEVDALAFNGSTFDVDERDFALSLLRNVDSDADVSGVIENTINDTGDNGSLSDFGSSTEEETTSGNSNSGVQSGTLKEKILLAFKLLEPTTARDVWRLTGEERTTVHSYLSREIEDAGYAEIPQHNGGDETFNGKVYRITQDGLDHIQQEYGNETYVTAGFLYEDYGKYDITAENFEPSEKVDTVGDAQAAVLQAIEVLDDFNPGRGKIPVKERLGVTAFEVDNFLDGEQEDHGSVNHLQRKNMIRYTGHKYNGQRNGRWSYCLTVKGKRTLRDLDFDPRTIPRWPTSIRRGSSTSKTRKTS